MIPSGNIYSNPRKLGSKEKKKMILLRGPPNEHTNGPEHCKKRTYHHKMETMARRCLSNMFSGYRVTH